MKYTYHDAVEYLCKIPSFASKNTFENTRDFMHELGKFEEMKNVIHVAGTNGKGSVCSYVQSVLMQAGYTVGMFTSPHLVTINERIRINNECVSDEIFTCAFEKVKRTVDIRLKEGLPHPAFFEFIFAMACVIFEEKNLDYIILETGLGGRLDATNIVNKPLVSAITSIGLDHTQYLGDTISLIAEEKAGIIKEGVPVVFDADSMEVYDVISRKAALKHAQLIPVYEKNVKIKKNTNKRIDFLINSEYDKNICVSLSTCALYQVKNAHIAYEIIHNLFENFDDTVLIKGISSSKWRGRMEWIDSSFLLDGAHNMAGINKLVESLGALNTKILLLFAAVDDKDYEQMINVLCTNLDIVEVVITKLSVNRSADVGKLRELFRVHSDREIFTENCCEDAFLLAKSHLQKYEDAIIVATGSLYLVGEILSQDRIYSE